MTPAARVQAAIEVLDTILEETPVEKALSAWARRSRFAGSKDRAAVRDHVFDVLRQMRSATALGGRRTGRGLMLGLMRLQNAELDAIFSGQGHGPAQLEAWETPGPADPADTRDIPDWQWPLFQRALGEDADQAVETLRSRAQVHLRINSHRTSREEAISQLIQDGIVALPHQTVPTALVVTDGARAIRNSRALNDGLVELQDAHSQALAAEGHQQGGRVLDYCSGGGGKALAMASLGSIVTAHDINPMRLVDLPARAKRAGLAIDVAQTADLSQLPQFDTVFCDAPCSGSGSWRRDPKGKWALTQGRLGEIIALQEEVLKAAFRYVKPGGCLVYGTCSVFVEENEDQTARFIKRHPSVYSDPPKRWPIAPDGDGFFAQTLHLPD